MYKIKYKCFNCSKEVTMSKDLPDYQGFPCYYCGNVFTVVSVKKIIDTLIGAPVIFYDNE